MKSIVWFRRDLRILDNSALYHAAEDSSGGVVGLYVITPKQWAEHNDAACKVRFWLKNLELLSQELAELNIPLRIEVSTGFEESTDVIMSFAAKQKVSAMYVNREYEFNELKRDKIVEARCAKAQIKFNAYHDLSLIHI